jgi:hypothetical protein
MDGAAPWEVVPPAEADLVRGRQCWLVGGPDAPPFAASSHAGWRDTPVVRGRRLGVAPGEAVGVSDPGRGRTAPRGPSIPES